MLPRPRSTDPSRTRMRVGPAHAPWNPADPPGIAARGLILQPDDDDPDDEFDDEDDDEADPEEDEDDESAWGDEASDEPEWQVNPGRLSRRVH